MGHLYRKIKTSLLDVQRSLEKSDVKRALLNLQVIWLHIVDTLLKPVDFIRRHYDNFKRGVAFFKKGYYNYDFDYAYLEDLMSWKLRRMSAAFEADKWHGNSKKIAKEAKIAAAYLDRISNVPHHTTQAIQEISDREFAEWRKRGYCLDSDLEGVLTPIEKKVLHKDNKSHHERVKEARLTAYTYLYKHIQRFWS